MDPKNSESKEVKIIKKNIHFITFANSVSIVAIIFFVVIIILWSWVLQKEKTAPLVIESDGTPAAVKYTNGQKDNTYQTSGYSFAALGQPCVQEHSQSAVPNLPESYEIPGCNETDRKVCVENFVKGGGICLSGLGGACRSLYDCAPGQGATKCLNNVCVNTYDLDSINQPCKSDESCQAFGQNHVCDPQLKVCKYNYFPYESGCLIDEDCLEDDDYNKNMCLHINSEGLSLSSVYTALITGNYFVIFDTTSPNLPFFGKNTTVSIIDDDKNYSVYRLTSNLISIPNQSSEGYLSEYISGPALEDGDLKLIIVGDTGGEQLGICVSKIPRGGKTFDIAGVQIPCDDGLIINDGFCVKNGFFSGPKIICDRRGNIGSLTCDPKQSASFYNTTTGQEDIYKLLCLGNISIRDEFSQNFNYTYPSLIGEKTSEFVEEIPFLGYCNYGTNKFLETCNPDINNCEEPYLCIDAKDGNGKDINFCGLDFNRQECFVSSDCQDGYLCNDGVCLSGVNTMCLDLGDCDPTTTNGCDTGNKFIYYYSVQENKYIQLFSVSKDHINPITIRYNSSVVNKSSSNFSGMPTKFLFFSINPDQRIATSDSLVQQNGYQALFSPGYYQGDQAIVSLYTYSSTSDSYIDKDVTVNLYPPLAGGENYQKVFFVDFILNGSDQIYSIYRKNSEADRIRKITINSVVDTTHFKLNVNSGFANQDIIIYRGGNLYPQDTTYYIRIDAGSTLNGYVDETFYLSSTPTGSPITMTTTNAPLGEIWSANKTYNLQMPKQPDDPSNQQYKSTIIGSTFENGDSFTLDPTKILSINGDDYQARTFYLQKTSNLFSYPGVIAGNNIANSYFYSLTDQYEQSQGSNPFINTVRQTYQEIYVDGTTYANIEINQESVNYSTSLIDIDNIVQYIVKDEDYVGGDLNGINSSMSYNFDSTDDGSVELTAGGDDITFELFSSEGNDYVLMKKNLIHGASNNQQFPLVQRFKISNTTTKPTGEVYLETKIFFGSSTITTYFVLNYDLSASPPLPPSLYSSGGNQLGTNQLSEVKNSPLTAFSEEGGMNIISSYINSQDISTNVGPTTLVVSSLEETNLSSDVPQYTPPKVEYTNNQLSADSIPITIINYQKYDGKSKQNTYQINSNTITIRVENDIDTILKYGSSEIVFVKTLFNIPQPGFTDPSYFEINMFQHGNITLVVSEVIEYSVGEAGEYLTLGINTPLYTDSGVRNAILGAGDNWEIYVNNIYPIYCKFLTMEPVGLISLYNIFDASGFYTSTKQDSFFDESQNNQYRPTSYNKIFSTSNDGLLSVNAIYVNDGYGTSDNYDSTLLSTSDDPPAILLPNMIDYTGDSNVLVPTLNTTYPLTSLRATSNIFGYFYPIKDLFMISAYTSGDHLNDVFNGHSFIRSTNDYSTFPPGSGIDVGNNFSYVRPINSGIIKLAGSNGALNGLVYAANNLFMSNIPRSFPSTSTPPPPPYFNLRILEEYFSIYSKGRRKGSIRAGVNTIPYYPTISGATINLDQSYQKLAQWPSWVIENQLVEYQKVPSIERIFFSPDRGNFKGDFTYYVLAEIDGKHNLYYFSSSGDDQDITKNQGVPLTATVYEGGLNIDAVMIGQRLFIEGSACVTKKFS